MEGVLSIRENDPSLQWDLPDSAGSGENLAPVPRQGDLLLARVPDIQEPGVTGGCDIAFGLPCCATER